MAKGRKTGGRKKGTPNKMTANAREAIGQAFEAAGGVVAFGDTTPEALRAFHELSYDEQRAAVPGMADGHSGNTFGMALRLAYLYLTQPEGVAQLHGALAPLVGSDEYGCIPRPTVAEIEASS